MYYYLVDMDKLPEKVTISLADESIDLLEGKILSEETKTVSIKINNNEDYPINLQIGALVGFENGNIQDIVSDGEVLIK